MFGVQTQRCCQGLSLFKRLDFKPGYRNRMPKVIEVQSHLGIRLFQKIAGFELQICGKVKKWKSEKVCRNTDWQSVGTRDWQSRARSYPEFKLPLLACQSELSRRPDTRSVTAIAEFKLSFVNSVDSCEMSNSIFVVIILSHMCLRSPKFPDTSVAPDSFAGEFRTPENKMLRFWFQSQRDDTM